MAMQGIRLVDSDKEIARKMFLDWANQFNVRLSNAVNVLQAWLRDEVKDRLRRCSTVVSMKTGQLRKELGIERPDVIDEFIVTYSSSIRCKHALLTVTGGGGLSRKPIVRIETDETIQKLAQSDEYCIVTAKAAHLPFLWWLVNEGDKVIVLDYYYREGNKWERRHGISRAGGIMQTRVGARWCVPSAFSGDVHTNFVSRALLSDGPNIYDEIERILAKEMA